MRRCYKCEKRKPLSEFVNHKNKPEGKASVCKDCHRKYCRRYYRNHKFDYRKRAIKNRVSALESKKKGYKNNRINILRRAKAYAEKYPWISHYKAAYQRCLNPKNKCYNSYGKRGIKFLITRNEVKRLWFRDKAFLQKKPSIDRIDNDGNYTFKNCRFIEQTKNLRGRKSGYHSV